MKAPQRVLYASKVASPGGPKEGSDETYYRAVLFASKPLAYAHKKDTETKQAEDILARTVTVVSNLYFAGGVMTPGNVKELRTQ